MKKSVAALVAVFTGALRRHRCGGSISREELEESGLLSITLTLILILTLTLTLPSPGLLSIINDGERETGDLTIDGFMEEADTDGGAAQPMGANPNADP